MDCEGSELLVLGGAEETLLKNKVKIFCEIHHDFLKQLGHSIDDIVQYLQGLEFQVQSVSLNDLKVGAILKTVNIFIPQTEGGERLCSLIIIDYKCKE